MDLDLQASKDRDTGSTIADSEYNSPSRKNSDSDKRGSPVLRKSSNFLSPDGSSKRIQ